MTTTMKDALRTAGIDPRRMPDAGGRAWTVFADALGADHAGTALARSLARSHADDDVHQLAAQQIGAVAGADGVRIFEFRDDARAVPVGTWGSTPELARVVSPDGVPLNANTATGRAFRRPDAQRTVCAPGDRDPVMAWLARLGIRHTLSCPISHGGSAWGMVALMFAGDEPLPGIEDDVRELAELMLIAAAASHPRDAAAA